MLWASATKRLGRGLLVVRGIYFRISTGKVLVFDVLVGTSVHKSFFGGVFHDGFRVCGTGIMRLESGGQDF